jgi:2-isopropylmalate synthase
MERRILIFDTTLRDGEQAPGYSMNLQEKLRMAEQLERLRVDVIEAGFPIASQGDFEAVREIARRARYAQVAGLCRTKKEDIDCAWQAVQHARRPRLHTFLATSDIHLEHKLRMTREEMLETTIWAVRYARSLTDDVEFSPEDATRSDVGFLCRVVEAAIDAGATVINIPDTVGYAVPSEYGRLIETLMRQVRNIERVTVSVHCHNDLGLAVANSLAGVEAGACQIECTINGIGERAGNAALEEVIMALRTRSSHFHADTNLRTEEIYPTSRMLAEITGVGVQPNKAVVGQNAFAHEAGIHQDGVLKNALTYEIMTPQSVGVPSNRLVLGKHSGRHALRERFRALGFEFDRQELDRAYAAFIRLADTKKVIVDEDLIAIATNGVSEMGDEFVQEKMQRFLDEK